MKIDFISAALSVGQYPVSHVCCKSDVLSEDHAVNCRMNFENLKLLRREESFLRVSLEDFIVFFSRKM